VVVMLIGCSSFATPTPTPLSRQAILIMLTA